MVVHDDDITSVLKTVGIYKKIKQLNPEAKLAVVGGDISLVFFVA
jgi:hypothetical protein